MGIEPTVQRKQLGTLLVEAGLINEQQLQVALEEQKKQGGKLGFNLVKLGFVSPFHLGTFLQDHFGVSLLQENSPTRQKAVEVLPRYLALYYKIAPIMLKKDTLTIAISQIEHPNFIELLGEVTGYRIDPVIYPEQQIRMLVDASYTLPSDHGVEISPTTENTFVVVDHQRKIKALTPSQLKNEKDAGEWLRGIIVEAIREKSREILIRPETNGASVSFKKDAFYPSEISLEAGLHDDLTFLLFRLSRLNPLQQQKAQHGRFHVRVNDRKVVMITSAFPTIYGARFLLEMFDEKLLKHSFEELMKGVPELKQHLEELLVPGRNGLCVVTGPEGSGKTSLLYSLMTRSKHLFRNIMTLETAVRYPLSGITQTQISESEMDHALEDLIKQKPDLVLIDSIRKQRSAERAFLVAARVPVIATLPCFDVFVALDWLCSRGLKSAIKAGLLHTIVSPRFIPHLCANCSIPCELTPDQMQDFSGFSGTQPKMNPGCDACRNGVDHSAEIVFEYLRIDQQIIAWLEEDHSAPILRSRARKIGRKALFDVVLQNPWNDQLDMLSILKLRSVI